MVIGFVVPLTEKLINIHGILAGVGKSIRMTIRKWKIERGKSPENDLCPSQTDMNREVKQGNLYSRPSPPFHPSHRRHYCHRSLCRGFLIKSSRDKKLKMV